MPDGVGGAQLRLPLSRFIAVFVAAANLVDSLRQNIVTLMCCCTGMSDINMMPTVSG